MAVAQQERRKTWQEKRSAGKLSRNSRTSAAWRSCTWSSRRKSARPNGAASRCRGIDGLRPARPRRRARNRPRRGFPGASTIPTNGVPAWQGRRFPFQSGVPGQPASTASPFVAAAAGLVGPDGGGAWRIRGLSKPAGLCQPPPRFGQESRVQSRADGATPRNLSGKQTAGPTLWREMPRASAEGRSRHAVTLSGKRTEGDAPQAGGFATLDRDG